MARGRMATSPFDIPRAGWVDILARVKSRIGADRLTLIAAGVAFFGLLALFPAISAVLAIAGLVLDTDRVIAQLDRMQGVVPPDVLSIIRDQATSVTTSEGLGTALVISVALALWSASRGVANLTDGLNVVHGETDERGFFAKNAQILALTAAVILGVIVGLVSMIGVPVLLSHFPLGPVADPLMRVARWLLLAAMSVGGIALIYRFGPARAAPRWIWVVPGAVLAWILWIAASYGFTVYVAKFANYSESFGALAGVIVLLMWLWITVLVILIGAEVNAEAEHQTRMDTTAGAPQPRGERGAKVADGLGSPREG